MIEKKKKKEKNQTVIIRARVLGPYDGRGYFSNNPRVNF